MSYFDDEQKAVKQVLRDKNTILEGYVTEYLFEHQFLADRSGSFTQGWWCARSNTHQIFFVVKQDLNTIDTEFASHLTSNYDVWQAKLSDTGQWDFVSIPKTGVAARMLTEAQFVSEYALPTFRSSLLATTDVRDIDRQNKCVAFFRNNGILRKVATERYFADDFLFRHFPSAVNVDFVTKNRDGALCVLEVKFKYETRAGKFGVDSGQYHMLTQLHTLGLQIHHIILYNFTKQKDLTIFGFLTTNEASRHWKIGRLTGGVAAYETIAPRYTSIDGKKLQPYFALDKTLFSKTVPFSPGNTCLDF